MALALLAVATGIVALWRLLQGPWLIPAGQVARALLGEASGPEAAVVWRLRLPRLVGALAAGGILSVSGATLQALLGNPLAEPYTLGIAAGAALGASTSFFGLGGTTLMAFSGALLALWLVSTLAWRAGGGTSSLVLAGIVVSAICSSGVTLLKALADERLGAIVLWLMGSLTGMAPGGAVLLALAALPVLVVPWFLGRWLDALTLGEGQAVLLGVPVITLRRALLALVSLGTAVVVAHCGIIGFLGLLAPHLVRLSGVRDHRRLVPLCFLGGALLLAAADGLSQALGELPVGVLTALIGGPLFCRVLVASRRRS